MNKLLYRFEMLILASEKDENTEPLWLRFYIIQMTFYIFINEKSCLSKDQVHEAYLKIKEEYNELKKFMKKNEFSIKNVDNLIKSIKIFS